MLRVKIELHPAGEEPVQLLHSIDIVNDETGSFLSGNYEVTLDGKEQVKIMRYPRKLGALRLAQKALIELTAARFREGWRQLAGVQDGSEEGPSR